MEIHSIGDAVWFVLWIVVFGLPWLMGISKILVEVFGMGERGRGDPTV